MNNQGYIKLYRSLLDNDLWKEKRVFSKVEAWLDILMQVQHSKEPTTVLIGYQTFIVNRGESIKSMETWAKRWKWSRSKCLRYLNMLQNQNMICLKTNTKTTIIKVVNYDKFQLERTTSEHQANIKRTSNEHQSNTDKNVNNAKNVNNDNININTPVSIEPGFDSKKTKKDLEVKTTTPQYSHKQFIEDFQKLTGKKHKGNAKSERQLKNLLKAGYTQKDISIAITNCFNTEFHKLNPQYLTPEFITRQDKFDTYLAYEKPTTPSQPAKSFRQQDIEAATNRMDHYVTNIQQMSHMIESSEGEELLKNILDS